MAANRHVDFTPKHLLLGQVASRDVRDLEIDQRKYAAWPRANLLEQQILQVTTNREATAGVITGYSLRKAGKESITNWLPKFAMTATVCSFCKTARSRGSYRLWCAH